MQLVLITGLSGSGKSVALNALEDAGYYCVDNLPVKLLPELVEFLAHAGYSRVALSIDVRSGEALDALPQHLAALRSAGTDVKILFLEAKNDTLIQRFSETRRRHPLGDGRRTLPESIARERELLEDIAALLASHRHERALSPNVLAELGARVRRRCPTAGLTLLFQSFAYKHGMPLDADMVFDVRCLPNPHYDPKLRPYTGRDEPVIEFCEADPAVQKMLGDITPLRRRMAAVLRSRQPQLSHRRHRLHRRPAPLGISRRKRSPRISARSHDARAGVAIAEPSRFEAA